MRNEVKSFFEKPEIYLNKNFGVVFRTELINKEIGKVNNKNILDIGCGNGAISMPYIVSNHITFLDFSENMLNLVQQSVPVKYKENAVIRNIDFSDMPQSEKFDIILLIGVLAHVQRPLLDVFTQLKSQLDSGGRVYFQFTNYDNYLAKLAFLINKSNYEVSRISKSEILKYTNKAGFKIYKSINYATVLPGMGVLPNNVLLRYIKIVSGWKIFSFMRTEYLYILD